MGILSSIFKSIVETTTSGDADKVYDFNFAGFYDRPNFMSCFDGNGHASDGGLLIRQVCAFGLMRLIQKNELAEYKDDYISAIADHMPGFAALVAQCIQEGESLRCGVRNIEKFINLEYSGDQLVRTTVQVTADSGHRITMRLRLPENMFYVSSYSLERCSYIPGFHKPSSY